MIWVRVRDGGRTAALLKSPDAATPARQAAETAAMLIKHQDSPHRAVLLFNAGEAGGPRGEPPLFPDDDRNIDAFARGGLIDFTRHWAAEFWDELARQRAEPDLILLDNEYGTGFWDIRDERTPLAVDHPEAPTWARPTIALLEHLEHVMGGLPGGYAPLDYVREDGQWRFNHQAITAFNEWAGARHAHALKVALLQPAWNAFQKNIPAANFSEQLRAWPGLDTNNWPVNNGFLSGTWSSPSTYLGTSGQRYSVKFASAAAAYRQALSWLDRRNDVRSALALSRDVAPWYSNPDYGCDVGEDLRAHRLAWAAGLLHDRSLGISVMLFWSDRPWNDGEIAFARPILTYLRLMPPSKQSKIGKLDEERAEDILSDWVRLAARLSHQ